MFSISKVADNIYRATSDKKSLHILVAVQSEAIGRPGVSEIERLSQLLELNIKLPDNWSMSIDTIDKSIFARSSVRKHMGLAEDGTVLCLLCRTQAVANQAIKVMQEYGA